jgi:hypothetical protein
MKGTFLLNIIIRKSSPVLELFTSKNEPLLIGRDAFLILDLRLDVIDGVGRLNFQGDGLPCKRLHKDLHTTTKTEDCE